MKSWEPVDEKAGVNLSVIAVDLQTFCCDFEKYKTYGFNFITKVSV